MAAQDAFPTSYKDPLYASLDAAHEQKLGLPVGLLASVRTNGERTNHGQVSSAGAVTPYQFTPATRKAILNKYGIDVTLNPQNASEGAGLLLKEGLDRNQGDLAAAVGEYVGGLDRKEWGNVTKSYINRVMVGQKQTKDSALDNAFAKWMAGNPAVPAGRDTSAAPAPAAPAAQPSQADPLADAFGKWVSNQTLPAEAIDAYAAGKLPPNEMERIKAGVADGSIKLPAGVSLGNTSAVGRIPGIDPNTQLSQPEPEPSFGDKVIGAGEAAANLATGMTGGTVGMAGGFVKGLTNAILDGSYGAKQAADLVEQEAMKGADALTYQPRTPTGQQYAENVGEVMNQLAPVAAIAHTLPPMVTAARGTPRGVMARTGIEGVARDAADFAAKPAETVGILAPGAAGDVAASGAARATDATQAGAQRVASMAKTASTLPRRALAAVTGGDVAGTPTPGTMASGGAAGTDMALQRRATAESLPVPIEITKGQAERSFEQQRFEQETAKDPYAGAPLRERFADQNQKILENFDHLIDKTGTEAPSLRAVGASVDAALVKQYGRDKTEVNAAYAKASKSPEASAKVDHTMPVQIGEGDNAITSTPFDWINSQPSGLPNVALIDAARQDAVRLGIANLQNGKLVPKTETVRQFPTWMRDQTATTEQPIGSSIRQMEDWRKAINQRVGFDPQEIRQATIMKALIDGQTEPVAGPLYQQARNLRARMAQNYEDRAAIAKLLNNKRGMTDRQVALEDVFNHSMLNSSLDDVRNMRRVLQRSGSQGEQAWRDLQGQTMQWIKDQATKRVATDIRGNQIVSAADLDKAIKTLDHDGKLDFIFGKKGAQTVREINDLTKVVHTSPPGSVNTSNTASVLLAALTEAGATGALTGLPVPVLSGLKGLATYAKHRRLQAKVQEALGKKPTHLKSVPKSTPSGKPVH